jgi:hypothetical protein
MSKRETPMTEAFWQSQATGTFIAKYPWSFAVLIALRGSSMD